MFSVSKNFSKNGTKPNYLLETQLVELLESGFQNRRFQQSGDKVKQNGKKKTFERSKWGFGEEWRDELWYSESRMTGGIGNLSQKGRRSRWGNLYRNTSPHSHST
jgi:hypothetical protein